jgi:uncharacterized membrane protein
MADKDKDTVLVFAASYDTLEEAEDDYEAIRALYREVKTSHDFDAAVIERDEEGNARVVKKNEQPTRHGAAKGLKWGLAIGAATALFPAIGLAGGLLVGGGAGAAVGAVRGHMKEGLNDDDLKGIANTLQKGEYGVLAVYATNMADQVAANVKAVNRYVSGEVDARADQLAKQIKEADAAA